MAATEGKLSELHDAVATALAKAIEGQEISYFDDETQTQIVNVVPPSAAILQVAAKFLKDNEVTCAPSDDNAMGALKEAAARRAKAREDFKASKADKANATADASFLTGLH